MILHDDISFINFLVAWRSFFSCLCFSFDSVMVGVAVDVAGWCTGDVGCDIVWLGDTTDCADGGSTLSKAVFGSAALCGDIIRAEKFSVPADGDRTDDEFDDGDSGAGTVFTAAPVAWFCATLLVSEISPTIGDETRVGGRTSELFALLSSKDVEATEWVGLRGLGHRLLFLLVTWKSSKIN